MAGISVPVEIRGVAYKSQSEAARALNVSTQAINHARRRGTLDFIGRQPWSAAKLIRLLAEAPPTQFDILQREALKWVNFHKMRYGK